MYTSGVGLLGTRLNSSQPSDAEQRACLSDSEGCCSAQSSSLDGTYPSQTHLYQRLQAPEHCRQAAPQDRQNGILTL